VMTGENAETKPSERDAAYQQGWRECWDYLRFMRYTRQPLPKRPAETGGEAEAARLQGDGDEAEAGTAA
jgi:hypothetical protein